MGDINIRNRKRIRELTNLIRWRVGVVLPDDDAGREYLQLVVDHHAHLREGATKALLFAGLWAPWMAPDELKTMIETSLQLRRFWSAEQLGHALNLAFAERAELRITTIAPADIDPEEIARRRREEKARKAKAKRRSDSEKAGRHVGSCRLSQRAQITLDALRLEQRFFSVSELVPLLRLQFKNRRGRVSSEVSMRKLISRVLDELAAADLISERLMPARNGLKSRSARAKGAVPDQSVTLACHGDTVTNQ